MNFTLDELDALEAVARFGIEKKPRITPLLISAVGKLMILRDELLKE